MRVTHWCVSLLKVILTVHGISKHFDFQTWVDKNKWIRRSESKLHYIVYSITRSETNACLCNVKIKKVEFGKWKE